MIKIDVTPEEQQILTEVLTAAVSNLGMEIADTDQMDYREVLKKRKATLSKVLQALR